MAAPKFTPRAGATQTAAVAAQTPLTKTAHNAPQHNAAQGQPQHDRPGRFGNTLFRHGRAGAGPGNRPGPRNGPTRRPRPAAQNTMVGNDEPDGGCNTEQDARQARAATPVQGGHADDQPSGDSERDQGQAQSKRGAAAFGLSVVVKCIERQPRDGSSEAGLTPKQFAQQALSAMDRLSTAPSSLGVRNTLLHNVLRCLDKVDAAAPDAKPVPGGLEAVRALLLDATQQRPHQPGATPARQDLNQLLPLMLLNLQRARTPEQAGIARSKLRVLMGKGT
jgi:hypothetical protein